MKRVYVLLGGMAGWADGWAVSRGMIDLAARIGKLPDVQCSWHYWTSWQSVANSIRTLPAHTKIVLVGYSGGGSRATWITEQVRREIALVIGYDPSPIISMGRFLGNVTRAICFVNRVPDFFGLGGGHFRGIAEKIETVTISEAHLAVQYDQSLHARTLKAISEI